MKLCVSKETERIFDAFQRRREERGFEFRPQEAEMDLGELALPLDAVGTILLGIAANLLTDILRRASSEAVDCARDPEAIVDALKQNTALLQDGLARLEQQGIRASDAKIALELFLESLAECALERGGS